MEKEKAYEASLYFLIKAINFFPALYPTREKRTDFVKLIWQVLDGLKVG